MVKINFESAKLILSDVPDNKKFVCSGGKVFVNLKELATGLKSMKKKVFVYHVNSKKNDFSSWVYDIIGDVKLAGDLRKIKDANLAAKKIRARITCLKKSVKKVS